VGGAVPRLPLNVFMEWIRTSVSLLRHRLLQLIGIHPVVQRQVPFPVQLESRDHCCGSRHIIRTKKSMTFDTAGKEDFRNFIRVIALPLYCTRGARVRCETGLSAMCVSLPRYEEG